MLSPYDTSQSLIPQGGGLPAQPAPTLLPAQRSCSQRESCALDLPLKAALLPLSNWDGAYFVHLALPSGGYTHESFHAFFPGYPALLALLRWGLLGPLEHWGLLSPRPALLLTGAALNLALCAAATLALHRLTLRVLRCPQLAQAAALAFALTPGGVFFTALYTEALFACLTFTGLLLLEEAAAAAEAEAAEAEAVVAAVSTCLGCSTPVLLTLAAVLLTAASAVRSNGLLSAGFSAWALLRIARASAFSAPSSSSSSAAAACQSRRPASSPALLCLAGAFALAGPCAPLPAFQRYAAWRLCPAAAWCHAPSTLYAHIQGAYWGVGFLSRWTLAQAPQFLLAAPMLCAAAAAAAAWAAAALQHAQKQRSGSSTSSSSSLTALLPPPHLLALLPYTLHWAALVCGGLLYAHPQVITRLCSAACPAVYWFLASAWGAGSGSAGKGLFRCGRAGVAGVAALSWQQAACRAVLAVWCLGYTLVGGGLFVGTVNWT